MPSSRLFVSIALAAFLACATPTGGCSCSPPNYQIHFVGFVTNTGGAVVGARVKASVFDVDCHSAPGSVAYLAPDGSLTDSTGHYRSELQTSFADTLCARLVARTASDSSVRDSVSVRIPSADTVRVDLTFP